MYLTWNLLPRARFRKKQKRTKFVNISRVCCIQLANSRSVKISPVDMVVHVLDGGYLFNDHVTVVYQVFVSFAERF